MMHIKIRELFETFGEVKDVVIRSSKKKGPALVVMATKEAAVSIFTHSLYINCSHKHLF